MAVAVMCCGCRSFLGKDGSTVDVGLPKGGIIPIHQIMGTLWKSFPDEAVIQQVADFPDGDSADIAARKAGWQIRDALGSNHRCPACVKEEREKRASEEVRRGAFIAWPPQGLIR